MVACVIALPFLTTVMNAAGIVGGYLAEATIVQTSPQLYFARAFSLMDFTDLIPATLKTAVFGFIIAVVSSYLGMNTTARHRGCRTRLDAQRRHVVGRADRRQRGAGAAHIHSLSQEQRSARRTADAAVRFESVTKAFGDHRVLDDVSFEIPRASGFCLLGRSGTGKSVTLRHIIGLLRPDSGRVMVDNQDVADVSTAARCPGYGKGWGFSFSMPRFSIR